MPGGLFNYLFNEPWVDEIKRVLGKRQYVKVKQERMQGVLLTIFVKRDHLVFIRNIRSSYVKTGLGGYLGNKGGIGISMKISSHTLCIVNSHLAAHDYNYKQRVEDFTRIYNELYFKKSDTSKLADHK